MTKQIIYPTFKDAQLLYTQYSTIENTSVLFNTLNHTIDSSYLNHLSCDNVREIYNKIILKYYPNEICIKSSFINQVLLKSKNHVTIFELPVGSSRADLCKINGKSIAYEIKTDLDNFSRLNKQINDYFEIFDEVFVICSENNLPNIINVIPFECGIYSYRLTKRGNYRFELIRKTCTKNITTPLKQLNLIRKSELFEYFKFSNNMNERNEITDCIMQHYTPESINRIFKTILKQRFGKQWMFLRNNLSDILEIDYQWFYKNQIDPQYIYK